MKVLKKSDIIPEVAVEHSVTEEVAKAAVDSYWGELIKAVRELRYLNIKIPELGEMRIARSKLDIAQEKVKRLMDKVGPDHYIYNDMERKLGFIGEARKMRDEEYEKRAELRQRRKEYDEAK